MNLLLAPQLYLYLLKSRPDLPEAELLYYTWCSHQGFVSRQNGAFSHTRSWDSEMDGILLPGLEMLKLVGIPILCHGLVAKDVVWWTISDLCMFWYVDNMMSICDSLADLEAVISTLLCHLKWGSQAVRNAGTRTFFHFGVFWLGKMKVISEPVIDKIPAFPFPWQ